ncbi:MAG: hypothetical protein R3C14_00630 [Caldilineaceae bacterium]
MLQNRAISTSLSSTVSTDLLQTARRTLPNGWLRVLYHTLRLPDDLYSFLLFFLTLLIICGGLTLHLMLATTILEKEAELVQLQAAYQAVERTNSTTVRIIAQESTLDKIKQRALEMGYEPAFKRRYYIIAADHSSSSSYSSGNDSSGN